MEYAFVTLDVFTKGIFGGNPLAVVFGAESLSGEVMQSIACEFNLSETAFVLSPTSSENTHHVRIFTPVAELPFAGHPTIGTAIALARAEGNTQNHHNYRFEEGIGVVPVSVSETADGKLRAELTVAQVPEQLCEELSQEQWAKVLGLDEDSLCKTGSEIGHWSCGASFSFVPVPDLTALRAATVDAALWTELLSSSQITGAFVFTREPENKSADIQARMFAPAHGIAEDPATGAAVAALAGWLVDSDKPKDGTHNWTIVQGVEMGRPSRLELEADIKNGTIHSVRVGGCAVPVTRGEITVP